MLQVGHLERFNPAVLAAREYVHQPLFVDVVQADGGPTQLRIVEDVAQQIFGKNGAARSNKGDFWHGEFLWVFADWLTKLKL